MPTPSTTNDVPASPVTEVPAIPATDGIAPNPPILVKATPTGTILYGFPEFTLSRMSNGSALLASSYRPLADACRVLSAAGESDLAMVTVMTPKEDGELAVRNTGGIGYGPSYSV